MRTIIGQRNDDKGGLKLLYKFPMTTFSKFSKSVTFSWKSLFHEDNIQKDWAEKELT